MRTTLQDQITDAAEQRQREHRQDHFEWMLAHAHLITHAVTLTLDPKKITYSTKGSKYANRESIDWLNVRIPRSPDLITTKS